MKKTLIAGETLITRLIILALLAGLLLAANADEPTPIPTVTVVGKRQVDSEPLTCSSGPCFDSANETAIQAYIEWQQMYATIPPEDLPLDGQLFCQNLGMRPTVVAPAA